MSLPQAKDAGHTIQEWKSWEGRWELIHGVAFEMTPAPGPAHQRVSIRLATGIFNALEAWRSRSGGGECEVLSAPIDLYLPDQESVYQPDLLVVCDPAKVAPHGVIGIPDLIIEILSPSSASRDTVRKRWAYERAGVPEYLIVDPGEQVGLLLRLEEGRYREVARVDWGGVLPLLGGRLPVALGN